MGNEENSVYLRGFSEQPISCGEKRQRLSPFDQIKNVESVQSISPFQNGRPFSVKTLNIAERLDVQTGFEGYTL